MWGLLSQLSNIVQSKVPPADKEISCGPLNPQRSKDQQKAIVLWALLAPPGNPEVFSACKVLPWGIGLQDPDSAVPGLSHLKLDARVWTTHTETWEWSTQKVDASSSHKRIPPHLFASNWQKKKKLFPQEWVSRQNTVEPHMKITLLWSICNHIKPTSWYYICKCLDTKSDAIRNCLSSQTPELLKSMTNHWEIQTQGTHETAQSLL